MKRKKKLIYRFYQFVSLLLGMRIFVLLFFIFNLYVSTFFIFNQDENLKSFLFDYKVNGIIFCLVLSIAAGSIINQFYDLDKDKIQRPFRYRLQNFLKQRYFLCVYILLNLLCLTIAAFLSHRIFIFFVIYQFVMWYYSHKLSKIVFLNNLTYVALTLYPFFGMVVYYRYFSMKLFSMAVFLFLILWILDILKDILTMRPDKLFGYDTIPIRFGIRFTVLFLSVLLLLNAIVSYWVVYYNPEINFLVIYFTLSTFVLIISLWPLFYFKLKRVLWLMNLLRIWIFVGVIFMLLNGLFEKSIFFLK